MLERAGFPRLLVRIDHDPAKRLLPIVVTRRIPIIGKAGRTGCLKPRGGMELPYYKNEE